MKKLNLLLAGIIFSGIAVSCSDDDSAAASVNASPTAVINNMKSGTWRITSFIDDGNDETNHFTNFNFTFDENNVITATNGTSTFNGLWTVTNDDSSDDDNSSDSDIDFNIVFSSPDMFTDLTDDWDIMERSGIRIKLRDVSGGNGGTDYLVFEKN
ncbi:hypothetical protein HYN59_00610 [Flavobacterium album]|uniref:Lipocalin-like domain-containing protein n=1 Tax=Flavobacterium album TaxID=2175091 RepID=A0A2S1QTJ6_9FLAO|nr:hypothetical protein [Flavobacterium album]AWH83705.1 hypothetical protein HYN59_00610 [Flavobacterium album]